MTVDGEEKFTQEASAVPNRVSSIPSKINKRTSTIVKYQPAKDKSPRQMASEAKHLLRWSISITFSSYHKSL